MEAPKDPNGLPALQLSVSVPKKLPSVPCSVRKARSPVRSALCSVRSDALCSVRSVFYPLFPCKEVSYIPSGHLWGAGSQLPGTAAF